MCSILFPVADLYAAWVAPTLGSGLLTETWRNGGHVMPTNCSSDLKVAIYVKMTSHERQGVSNHMHIDYSFKSLFRRMTQKTSMLCIIGLCERKLLISGGWIPLTKRHWCYLWKESVSLPWRQHYGPPGSVVKLSYKSYNVYRFLHHAKITSSLNPKRWYWSLK